MYALAIDTSTPFLSLALQKNDLFFSEHIEVGQKHAEKILPTLENLLLKHDITLSELDYIAYAQGPGSFTGLRIGVGIAQGISMATQVPLIGIPTLDTLASLAPQHECVLAAIDARMNEVFYAWYNTQSKTRLSDYRVDKPENIQEPEQPYIGIGNAFSVYPALQGKGENKMPTALDYLKLAQSGRYPKTNPEEAELLYIRNKVALTASEQLQRKA